MVRQIGPYQDALSLHDVQQIDAVPPGTLKVQVSAAGLSFPELLTVEGKHFTKKKTPFVPGNQVAGVVLAVGTGVDRWAVGDRVAGSSAAGHGALADETLLDARTAWPIPARLAPEAVISLVGNYSAVHNALVTVGQVRAEDTVLVLGAGGACGLAAIDLAKAYGAYVVACASDEAKLEACRAARADIVINYEAGGADGFLATLRQAGVYGKATLIFDPVGGRYAEGAFRAMAPGGRHVVFGFAAGGTDPKSAFPNFPINLLLMRGQRILGAIGGSPASAMLEMLDMANNGHLRPTVGKTYALERFADAFHDLAMRKAVGQVVVVTSAASARL